MPIVSSEYTEPQANNYRLRKVWLKDLDDPSNNFHMMVEDTWIEIEPRGEFSVQDPVGGGGSIVLQSDNESEDIAVTMVAVGEEDYNRLFTILKLKHDILLQTPHRQWYVQLSDKPTSEFIPWMEPGEEWYRTKLRFTTVEKP